MEQNEAAVSCVLVQFKELSETFLLVGTAQNLIPHPQKSFTGAYILTFAISETGEKLEFIHRTKVEEIPYAMVAWKGKVLVGVGKSMRAYEMGKRQLLKKAEIKNIT